MNNDVLTFGETMLRLSPPGRERLTEARAFEVWVGGSESNVAAALCVFGVSVTWVSRLPDHPLGRRVAEELRRRGVDVSQVVWTAETDRVGTFYAEPGASPRAAQVVYDRANSAAAALRSADLPDALFATHKHLHVSGITPALSPSCADAMTDAIRRAKAHGLTVSLDINYRAKLWSPEAAAAALSPLLSQTEVLICSRDDAARLFGLTGGDAERARGLWERASHPTVVLTTGGDGAIGCGDGTCVTVPAFPVETTVERIGSGDAFAAGFLAGFLAKKSLEESLRMGVAAGALKRTIAGDILTATRREIDALLAQETALGWR